MKDYASRIFGTQEVEPTKDYAGRILNPQEAPQPQPQSQPTESPQSFGEFLEPMLSMGTGMIADATAGWKGILQAINPFSEEGAGARAVEETRKDYTYVPRSDFGKQTLTEIGKGMKPFTDLIDVPKEFLGDKTMEITGSPTAATMLYTLPDAIAMYLGAKGLKANHPGYRLLEEGTKTPTREFRRLLDSAGIEYENQPLAVRETIPEIVKPGIVPGGKPLTKELNKVVGANIEAGSGDVGLAFKKLNPEGQVVRDALAKRAAKQGFKPDFLQSVKVASNQTKLLEREMLRIMRRIKKQSSLGGKIHPSDVMGKPLTRAISVIGEKMDEARSRLREIATTDLVGVYPDLTKLKETIFREFGKLEIGTKRNKKGIRVLDYQPSLIAKDRTSQKVINDTVDLILTGGRLDAKRLHNIKGQLDNMVDYRNSGPYKITPAGKNVVKSIRHTINEILRETNTEYADVNDVLSTSLDSMSDLQDAVGKIDILSDYAEEGLGAKVRRLLGHDAKRSQLKAAIQQIQDVARGFGDKSDVDLSALADFEQTIADRFGTTEKNSFVGQITQANNASLPSKEGLMNAAYSKGKNVVRKARKINDFEAFEALDDLLK